jgi:hypothetical protein
MMLPGQRTSTVLLHERAHHVRRRPAHLSRESVQGQRAPAGRASSAWPRFRGSPAFKVTLFCPWPPRSGMAVHGAGRDYDA